MSRVDDAGFDIDAETDTDADTDDSPRPLTVAVLVTTYRRNDKLLRCVGALQTAIAGYAGPNRYFVCVADSDRANRVALPAGVGRVVNPGDGFDDNWLAGLRALAGAADFVFAMADDDRPDPTIDPLAAIDTALADAGDTADVLLFNHLSCRGDVGPEEGTRFWGIAETVNLGSDPIPMLGGRLPRYCGLLYRTAFIAAEADSLAAFRATLHAYAAPIFIAADRGRFRFVDRGVALFDSAPKDDGAWENARRVHHGLMLFLRALEPCIAPAAFESVLRGLYWVFFRVNRKAVWGVDLSGVPDFATLEAFREELGRLPAAAAATGSSAMDLKQAIDPSSR